jgi:2-polyprenyl-6-methoxyphenol hydroxylase-like FAD-dependent oxidoreductase
VSLPQADSLFVFEGETLLGADFQRRGLPVDEVSRSSPARELICSQELLEPVLRERAQDDGADVRFSTEVAGFTQDNDGVGAEIAADGEPIAVRATYMVAADGVRGRTREALGVSRSGPGAIGYRVSILVEARAPSTGYGSRCRDHCSPRSTTRAAGCSRSPTIRTPNPQNR